MNKNRSGNKINLKYTFPNKRQRFYFKDTSSCQVPNLCAFFDLKRQEVYGSDGSSRDTSSKELFNADRLFCISTS